MMFDPNLLGEVKKEEDPKVIARLEKQAWFLVVIFLIVLCLGTGVMVSLHQTVPALLPNP